MTPTALPRLSQTHAALLSDLWQEGANAWLLTGPAQVGKKALALTVAALHNCAAPGLRQEALPCGECASCRAAALGAHPDVLLLSARTQTSTGKAARRKIIPIGAVLASRDTGRDYEQHVYEFLEVRPTYRRRVVMVDGAEHLNEQAANALLKLVEEPPHRALFLLLAEDLRAVMPTLISRSARMRVPPVPQGELERLLALTGVEVLGGSSDLLAFAGGRAGLLSQAEQVSSALHDAQHLTDAVRAGLWPALEAATALEKTFAPTLHPEALRFVWRAEGVRARAQADDALEALLEALEAYANPGLNFQVFALKLRAALAS